MTDYLLLAILGALLVVIGQLAHDDAPGRIAIGIFGFFLVVIGLAAWVLEALRIFA